MKAESGVNCRGKGDARCGAKILAAVRDAPLQANWEDGLRRGMPEGEMH
jgi:hypothetical protein